ncbi:MAG TPA: hypothetical protein VHB21_11175 [Minicystis sp.]|nr:hypothetical protein [Minicystis sp.]
MSAYRSEDEAWRARAEELVRELAAVEAESAALEVELARAEREAAAVAGRLAEAGLGGGSPGAARDRIGVAAVLLAFACVPLLPLHAIWHADLATDPTAVPAVLWLGAPGVLAAIVAWPHRRATLGCRLGLVLGVAFAVLAALHAAFGGLS